MRRCKRAAFAVTLSDLGTAARAVMAVPEAARVSLVRKLLSEMQRDPMATLASVALERPVKPPCAPGCRAYHEALALVLRELLAFTPDCMFCTRGGSDPGNDYVQGMPRQEEALCPRSKAS